MRYEAHPAACATCGYVPPHVGRRDLIAAVNNLEAMLAPVSSRRTMNLDQLVGVAELANRAWHDLVVLQWQLAGQCIHCKAKEMKATRVE